MTDFATKAIGRGIQCAPPHQAHHTLCTPAHKLPTPPQILAAEPLLQHRDEFKLILDLPVSCWSTGLLDSCSCYMAPAISDFFVSNFSTWPLFVGAVKAAYTVL